MRRRGSRTDREGTSKTPLYSDSFYMTVTQAVITAKVVTTDLKRTKELIKQFYQTNLGRDWRIDLAGLKARGIDHGGRCA